MSEDAPPDTSTARQQSPRSPEPSTSAASSPSAAAPDRLSVYSHIEGLQQIGQMRGLRTGRRRARFRGMRRTTIEVKYAEALSFLEPIFLQESLRLEEAHTLVAAAIEHFAITVSGIVDRLEGDRPKRDLADKSEKSDSRRTRAETAAEADTDAEKEAETDAEGERSLEAEACAAVAALSSGDTRGERLPALLRLASCRLRRNATLVPPDTSDTDDSD